MQRNQSASDTEARARVRSFLLDGAKQAVIANMAPYESALASAQGKAAIAKIDEELAKSYIDVYRHIDSNALALRQQAISKWQTQVNASLESQANSIRQQEANTHAKDVDNKNKPTIPRGIYDPETGHLVAYYKPGVKDDEMQKTDEELMATKSVSDDINELRALTRAMGNGGFDPITKTRFADTSQQKFDSLAQRLAHGMVKSMGERATDKDVDQMLAGLRTPSWLNAANAEQIIAFTQERIINGTRNRVSQLGFVPNRDGTIENAPNTIVFGGTSIDAKNTASPPPESLEEIRRKKAGMDIGNKRSKETLDADEVTGDVRKIHEAMLKERPDLFSGAAGTHEEINGYGLIENKPGGESVPVRRFEHGIAEYMDLAEKGDKNALADLQRIAASYTLNHDDPEAIAAAWALANLSTQDK
jgi:hypothetical protein